MTLEYKNIEEALGIQPRADNGYLEDLKLWISMMRGEAPWNDKDNPSLRLAKSVCRELAIHSVLELETQIDGGVRAQYLQEQYKGIPDDALDIVSKLCGHGKMVFKLFPRGKRILHKTVTPDCYYPLKYNELDEMVSVVFADKLTRGKNYYTLLETHSWEELAQTYSIEYKAYKSQSCSNIGRQIPLTDVEEWAYLQDLAFANVPQPLFVEVCLPEGRAIFSEAVEIIEEADKQFGRALWEYCGGELAVFADMTCFQRDKHGNWNVPKGKERLFKKVTSSNNNKDMFEPFAPDLRDESLFNGLNQIFRNIERIICFNRGIISDPDNVEKTAEEVRSSNRSFYATIRDIQKLVRSGLEKVIESMDILTTLYQLAPQGEHETQFTFGDSIMEDPDKEYTRRREQVSGGLLRGEKFIAWYYGITEEQAIAEYMPEAVAVIE